MQYVLNSLIAFEHLNYESTGKNLVTNLKATDVGKEEKNYFEKINSIIDFLVSKNLASTKEISFFSKVFMILENNRDYKEDFVSLIRNRASILGWGELTELSANKIKTYLREYDEFNRLIN